MTIKQALKKYPKLYLHYNDNGSCTLYKHKPTLKDYDTYQDENLEIMNDELLRLEEGYAPGIVVALCKALNIQVDSE